jgi:hypothetical protein
LRLRRQLIQTGLPESDECLISTGRAATILLWETANANVWHKCRIGLNVTAEAMAGPLRMCG